MSPTERSSFRPTIRDNHLLAGGLVLAEVAPNGCLVFEDRYRDRCRARGSRDVAVDLVELMEVLLVHYRADPAHDW